MQQYGISYRQDWQRLCGLLATAVIDRGPEYSNDNKSENGSIWSSNAPYYCPNNR